jgi:hypothetical protein
MKKLLCIIAILLLLGGTVQAQEWTFGSGQQTGAAVISTTSGLFYGMLIATDGGTPVTVNLYDTATSTSASTATKLVPEMVITSASYDRIQAIRPPGGPVRFFNGLYASPVSSGTFKYVIYTR